MRFRVVCGLDVTIAIFCPTRLFSSVDFPALGRPTMATKPARKLLFFGSIDSFGGVTAGGAPSIRRGNAERLHFAVEVAALEAQSRCRLRHVPAVFLQLAQNKFPLIGAACFVKRGIRVLRTLRHAAKDFGWEMVRLNARLRANNDQALDKVPQLANVSRPRVPQQDLHGGIAVLARSFAVCGAELVQEMSGEDGDVLFAVTQRRHKEGNYVQAVEKILAEGAAGNLLLEILVCGGENANIHAESLAGADRLEALLFQNAQHLRLRAQAHVADFVEEERTAIGFFEFADLILSGAGEAALHVPKKFRFDQLLRDSGAVHLDKQAFAAQAGGMQGPRHELFARAALAIDQHAAVGRRSDRNLLA